MLAKIKVNNMETLVSQSLIDLEISHEEFLLILRERDKCEKMKENFKNTDEDMRLKNAGWKKNNGVVDNCLNKYWKKQPEIIKHF